MGQTIEMMRTIKMVERRDCVVAPAWVGDYLRMARRCPDLAPDVQDAGGRVGDMGHMLTVTDDAAEVAAWVTVEGTEVMVWWAEPHWWAEQIESSQVR